MLINLLGQVRKIMSSKSDVGKLISYITIRATQNKNLSEIWTRARSFGEESRHTIVKTCNNTKNMYQYCWDFKSLLKGSLLVVCHSLLQINFQINQYYEDFYRNRQNKQYFFCVQLILWHHGNFIAKSISTQQNQSEIDLITKS
ncbi:unnamed protein product [Paramecium octaurelia]|uniref:Uncharacterized protein n=1 Tax=Paramecium octaurelia TaxID=43137 RepID=A0A8S1WE22_PAROT|nr:unnamed protein product [Paramecium octaurelia]